MVEHAKTVFSFALIAFFVALGLVGIVLPIIPGVLFLIIAALLASRHFPALRAYLERNRHTAKFTRLGQGFMQLGFWGKVRFCFWGLLKVTMDGIEWTTTLIAKLWRK